MIGAFDPNLPGAEAVMNRGLIAGLSGSDPRASGSSPDLWGYRAPQLSGYGVTTPGGLEAPTGGIGSPEPRGSRPYSPGVEARTARGWISDPFGSHP